MISFGATIGATRGSKERVTRNIMTFMRAGSIIQKNFGWTPQKLSAELSPLVLRSTARVHRCASSIPTRMSITATIH